MILLNDASLHGQFSSHHEFQIALKTVWEIRAFLLQQGHRLKISRTVRQRPVTSSQTFNDFLGSIPRDLRSRLLVWLDREGPFWEEERRHAPEEYFEFSEELITETSLAEAAHYSFIERRNVGVISFCPSSHCIDPLSVFLRRGEPEGDQEILLRNGWTSDQTKLISADFETEIRSWEALLTWCGRACPHLLLSQDIRRQLGIQFIPNVAKRSQVLLQQLNSIMEAYNVGDMDALRKRQEQMTEGRFSPSSTSELNDNVFKARLTFVHPVTREPILCSWHGKIQTPQYRIHFQSPLNLDSNKLFVAYIGPKLTKR